MFALFPRASGLPLLPPCLMLQQFEVWVIPSGKVYTNKESLLTVVGQVGTLSQCGLSERWVRVGGVNVALLPSSLSGFKLFSFRFNLLTYTAAWLCL